MLCNEQRLIVLMAVLERAGVDVCCWSNLSREYTREALISMGLLQMLDNIFYADQMLDMSSEDILDTSAGWSVFINTPEEVDPIGVCIALDITPPLWLQYVL